MNILDQFKDYFLPTYSNYPQGKYITVVLARWVESEAIFRTEGSGQPLNKEVVFAGTADTQEPIQRVVISKRKQTAVERRTGRELLRQHDLLGSTKGDVCALNRNNPCGECMDCMIYGYAAGGGGAQKSRVITDDAFSLHAQQMIVGEKQFNALFDNGTMRDPETGKASSSIGTDEYVKPQAVFLDMETIKDVTAGEFVYVLGNILRSTRYGAISSRIGKMKNMVLGVVFSDCEIFSNLELTQTVYERLEEEGGEVPFPIAKSAVHTAVTTAVSTLLGQVVGQTLLLNIDQIDALLAETTSLYSDGQKMADLLAETGKIYTP